MNLSTSWHKVISASAILLLSFAAGAPAQEQTTPPADQQNADKKVATAPIPTTAGAPVDSSSYKIGAADVLNIKVWNEPEFSGPVAVHQDGKITLPLVGDLQAGGKTPNEVQEIIADSLKTLVKKPLVTVTVQDVGSKRYYMDGLIARPGEYPLVVPTTILEAISKGGGLQDFANSKKIYILRGDKRIYFNYKDVIHGKHMEQNIPLEPGDHIVVP
ncbi:MAG: polysaccharide biosynthesis/export family protein [Acidobacteriaceae bacterium]|nr:polysaccharide biosynthesis/export family protein [Acidobacteriaceae bacterium]